MTRLARGPQPTRTSAKKFRLPKEPTSAKRPPFATGAKKASRGHTQTRQSLHAEASRLVASRADGHRVNEERLAARLLDLICKELLSERGGEGTPRRNQSENGEPSAPAHRLEHRPWPQVSCQPQTPGAHSVDRPAHTARAQAAAALVEKIEVFLKSQRPSLSMTLHSRLGALLEVERTGPREVAIRIKGRRGSPFPDDLTLLRDALGARGLKLAALRVG
ncbi:MAG: hypothetical protein ACOZIN_12980 [Myxococcota bacterium]